MTTFFFFSLVHAFSPVDLICTNHVTIFSWVSSYDLFGKQKGLTVVMLDDAGYKLRLGIGHELPGDGGELDKLIQFYEN